MIGGNYFIHIYYGEKYPLICKTIYSYKIRCMAEQGPIQLNGDAFENHIEKPVDVNIITDPEETIQFMYSREINELKVKFICKNDPENTKWINSNDKTFAKLLDRLLNTNLFYDSNEKLLADTFEGFSIKDIISNAMYENWINVLLECNNEEQEMKKLCYRLDLHLTLRTFIAMNTFTITDILLFFKMYPYIAFKSTSLYNSLHRYKNLSRWFRLINNLISFSEDEEMCSYLRHLHNTITYESKAAHANTSPKNKNATENKTKTKTKTVATSYEGKLEKAEKGKVVTRFPPEPSGYLHIGHAKAAFLNNYYATLYEGKMLLRFDDTNPVLEDIKYEQSIIEDLKNLGLKYDKVSYTSEYFDLLEEYCISLIKSGKAYADDTDVDTMRVQRGEGIESVNRNQSVEKNMELFEEMRKGSDIGQKHCIRAKIDMQSKNKCMRDPVIYRCIVEIPHHRYQFKYKCYPTYDFACPIIDSVEGVTHALRTNEYSDRIEQYNWMLNALQLRKVYIYEFSRISFVRTVMSKRKLKWFVENKVVDGWDDPRMPTVKGILRRGLCKDALFQFILEQGPSKAGNLMQWDKLWSINKQIIDPTIPRYAAVSTQGVHVKLTDLDSTIVESKRMLHPKYADLGSCSLFYTNDILIEQEDAAILEKGEEITIIKLGNIIINDIIQENNKIVEILATTHFDGDFKTTKKKIHWVPFIPDKLVQCILYEYDHLITVDKLEGDKSEWKDFVNYNSKYETNVYAEPEFKHVQVATRFQFERRGYFIVDSIKENVFHLIKIPDGKSKNMSIIETKVDAKQLAGTKDKIKREN